MADSPQERYERIQEILQEAIIRDYPNPERKGCPGDDTLRRLAERPRPTRDSDWEHVTHCSPCYREFLGFRSEVLERQQHGRAVRRRVLAAAVVVLVAVVAGYFFVRNRPGEIAKQPSPAASQNPSLVSAVLNLESQSEQRGAEKQPVGEIQRLPQKRLALSIYLPFGSEAGDYEVRLLNRDTDQEPVSTYRGTAQIENGLTILRLTVDLSAVPVGPHVLATKRGTEHWRYFRFVVG